MIVNRRDLARLPADDHELKLVVQLDEVARIALLCKEGVLRKDQSDVRRSNERLVPPPNRFRIEYSSLGAAGRQPHRAFRPFETLA